MKHLRPEHQRAYNALLVGLSLSQLGRTLNISERNATALAGSLWSAGYVHRVTRGSEMIYFVPLTDRDRLAGEGSGDEVRQ